MAPAATHLSIALCILQQVQQEIAGLDWPTTLSRRVALVLCLGCATDASSEAAEGDASLTANYILQVPLCLLQVHLAQGKGCLPRVLEVNTQVRPTGLHNQ